jgi:Ser/Thr protein kinase RdoA (MazF antagonist)
VFAGDSWTRVAEDPTPFLSLKLCTPAWLERALPTLLDATAATPFAGTELVHVDVRSDNLCISDGRALLIDWNQACVGNAAFDPAVLCPSMRAEGGAARDVSGTGAFAAWISGFAARAALPPPPTAPSVRPLQLAQLREALPWTVQVLGLPPLDHS